MSTPINVAKIVYGAFAVPWANRAAFARKLATPFAFLVIFGVVETLWITQMPSPLLWGVIALHLLVFVLFAVSCHRLVLLDTVTVAKAPLPRWTRRETRFLWRFIVLWFVSAAVGFTCIALLTFAVFPWLKKIEPTWLASLATLLFMLPMYYILARLSLVLPATAVDRRVNLGWAWELSEGNSWRLLLVVGVLPWIVSIPAYLIDFAGPNVVVTVAMTMLGAALLTVEISALSLAYRELTRNEPPTPAPPPAFPQTA